MLQGILYCSFGDLVEGDSVHFVRILLQSLHQMPGNGLSLTVRVSCKINLICLLGCLAKLGKQLALSTDGNVFRLEIILHIYSKLTLGKITHMAVGSLHIIICPKKFLYCLYFCR